MSNSRQDLSDWVIDKNAASPIASNKNSNDLSDWEVENSENKLNEQNNPYQKLKDIANNGIFQRPINRLGEDSWSLIKNIGGTLASGVPSTINELANNPGHAVRQLATGVATAPIAGMNAALNIPQWLAHLESNKVSDVMKKYTPQLPTDMYQNLLGGENPSEEDTAVRNLGQLAPIGVPIGKVAGKGAIKAMSNVKNTLGEAFADIQPHENVAANASQELIDAKNAARVPKPGLYQNPMTDLQDVEGQIGKHINAEADHRARAGRQITNRMEDIENHWSESYKNFEDKVRDTKFQMPESAMQNLDYANIDPSKLIQTYGADAFEAIKKGKMEDFVKKMQEKEAPENPYYKKLLDVAPTTEDTSAGDFLLKRRAFRDALYDLKKKIYDKRFSVLDEDTARKAATQGEQMMSQIDKTLDEGLGEFKPEFDRLNQGYSQQVYPLRNNPVIKSAKEGTLSKNIIDSLSTNESGMPLLRDIVKQDPELLKNLVGQRYMAKPSEVHAPSEQMREYLNEMPEFTDLLNRRKDILENAVNRKDLSLKNHIEVNRKLSEIKNAKSTARTKLLTAGMSAFVPYSYGKISKLFTK